MRLYMTELAVADLDASLRFYRDRLGLPVERLDAANGFALLHAGSRLALKQGTPGGGTTIHLEVEGLDAELRRLGEAADAKSSGEGYRRAKLRDPDGYTVVLFEWVGGSPRSQITHSAAIASAAAIIASQNHDRGRRGESSAERYVSQYGHRETSSSTSRRQRGHGTVGSSSSW